MRSFVIPSTQGNRPVVFHRPVFMISLLLLLLMTAFRSNMAANPSQPGGNVMVISPTPTAQIKVPAYGEPVILTPGNNASLASPIKLQLVTRPGEDGLVRIDLIGHDNRLIYRSIKDYSQYIDHSILIEEEIPFEVRADEAARLQVVLENAKGKTVFLTAVDLTLLQVKGAETNGDPAINPRLMIEQPVPGTSVVGKDLVIKGKFLPFNDTPVVIEVLTKDWNTLISKMITIKIPTDKTAYSSFEVKLPSGTTSETPVTIRFHQESKSLITGTVFLWSEKVNLVP